MWSNFSCDLPVMGADNFSCDPRLLRLPITVYCFALSVVPELVAVTIFDDGIDWATKEIFLCFVWPAVVVARRNWIG